MKIAGVFIIFSVAIAVDYAAAFGLDLLQNYYGALPALPPPPPPPPAPVPAPAIDPAYLAMLLSPPAPAAAPLPPPPSVALPAVDSKCSCCLSYIKPCIHAKLLNLKKKLIEKKLAHLLACCEHFNSHLAASHPC